MVSTEEAVIARLHMGNSHFEVLVDPYAASDLIEGKDIGGSDKGFGFSGEEEAEIGVNFCGRPHCGAEGTAQSLLIDDNAGGKITNICDIGPGELGKAPPGKGRKGFNELTLRFGVECVKD